MTIRPRRILLGVTVDLSVALMHGFPQYLAERGWDVHVVSSPGPSLTKLGETPGVTAHALPMARAPRPFADARSLLAWHRLLRQVRPDIISVGTPKAGLLASIAGWANRVPRRVYLLRGLRLETTGGLGRVVLTALERLAMGTSGEVLAVSSSLRARAIELKLVRPDKISVLGGGSSNGIDIDEFDRGRLSDVELAGARRSLGVTDGVPVVGFVGRLAEDKGLRVLADAMVKLGQDGVDHQLLIVGGVDDTTGQACVERLSSAGRPLIETGWVDNARVYYQMMDLLCLPTLREGFPNVVLEAGAAGIPTVTTNATGAVDAVIDGVTGLVVPVNDPTALAAALSLLIGDANLRDDCGKSARGFVEEHYSQEMVWANLLDYYLASDRTS